MAALLEPGQTLLGSPTNAPVLCCPFRPSRMRPLGRAFRLILQRTGMRQLHFVDFLIADSQVWFSNGSGAYHRRTLRWARIRAGASIDVVAERLKVPRTEVEAWEENRSLPSFAKARDAAKYLRVPFGYLFLDKPPAETVPIPHLPAADQRRAGEATRSRLLSGLSRRRCLAELVS